MTSKNIQDNNHPLLTVVCMVYNHQKHLKECLDGFVMQITNFPFQVLVHDDCSTDNSRKIIEEYAEKYSHIIKPLIEHENQYSKHDGSLRKSVEKYIRGKYVALCEGDDFWTDPFKLQKQVDFMENHPECSLCFHRVNLLYEGNTSNNLKSSRIYNHIKEGYYTGDEIIRKWTVPTCSAIMRTVHYLARPYDKGFAVGDNVMWLNSCKYGKAYCMNDIMATYRRNTAGWTLATYKGSKEKIVHAYERYYQHLNLLQKYFPGIADDGIKENKLTYLARIFQIYFFKLNKCTFHIFKEGIKLGKFKFLKAIAKTMTFSFQVRIKQIYKSHS